MIFLGTRGEIDLRSRQHRRHSALMIQRGTARVMIDCGADWLDLLDSLSPTAIVLTHAHPDHAGGLASGAPCPVYATGATLALLWRFPIQDPHTIAARAPWKVDGFGFEAVPLEHSTRAPAVGYRIAARTRCLFYAPDVAAIRDRGTALEGVDLYIGDGASIRRPLIRRRGRARIGHAPIVEQLDWCKDAGIPQALDRQQKWSLRNSARKTSLIWGGGTFPEKESTLVGGGGLAAGVSAQLRYPRAELAGNLVERLTLFPAGFWE